MALRLPLKTELEVAFAKSNKRGGRVAIFYTTGGMAEKERQLPMRDDDPRLQNAKRHWKDRNENELKLLQSA